MVVFASYGVAAALHPDRVLPGVAAAFVLNKLYITKLSVARTVTAACRLPSDNIEYTVPANGLTKEITC